MTPSEDQYGSAVDNLNRLPYTGSDITALLILAALILVLGVLLWRATRRG